LRSIERYKDRFEIKTVFNNSLYEISFSEIVKLDFENLPLYITFSIPVDKEAYSINCFEIKVNENDLEEMVRLYSIEVKGPWQLETIENDLQKIVKREFKTFRRRYYPL